MTSKLSIGVTSVALTSLLVGCGGSVAKRQPQEPSDHPPDVEHETALRGAISFRFAPPDGTKMVQTIISDRVKIFEGVGQQRDHSELKTSLLYQISGSTYTITMTPISMRSTRNGREFSDPMNEVLKDLVITYQVTRDGTISDIIGYGEMEEKADRLLPDNTKNALVPIMNEKALKARDKAEWNSRIADFVGAEVSIGESVVDKVPFTLPNGEDIIYYRHIVFSQLESCPAGTCLRVEINYNTDAAALSEIAADMADALQMGIAVKTSSVYILSGTVSRLIDPDTMLIYSEELKRTLKMDVQILGHGTVPTTMTEFRRYIFEYGD